MDPVVIEFDLTLSPQPPVAIPDAQLKAVLLGLVNELVGDAPADHLHLASNVVPADKGHVVGDFTEVTVGEMPGYAASAFGAGPIIASQLVKDTDGNWCYITPLVEIIATGVGTGVTIQSVYITDNANAVLNGHANLASPIPVTMPGQGFVGVIKMKLLAV